MCEEYPDSTELNHIPPKMTMKVSADSHTAVCLIIHMTMISRRCCATLCVGKENGRTRALAADGPEQTNPLRFLVFTWRRTPQSWTTVRTQWFAQTQTAIDTRQSPGLSVNNYPYITCTQHVKHDSSEGGFATIFPSVCTQTHSVTFTSFHLTCLLCAARSCARVFLSRVF